MKKAICLALTTVVLSLSLASKAKGQDATQRPSDETQVNRVIRLKYADRSHVRTLLARLGFNEEARVMDEEAGVVVIRGSQSHVKEVEDILKNLDVPPVPAKNVEITAYFLLANRQPSEAADMPPALNEVVAELKKVLNYRGFILLNTALMRTLDGGGGVIMGAADKGIPPNQFVLGYHRLSVITQEKQTFVHLDSLDFRIEREKHWEQISGSGGTGGHDVAQTNLAEIHTNIDIPEGQKVVVGKTAFGSSDNALVLVLTAKVLN